MATSKDLFDDSTMTFGEHLEVLRFHLIRALLGLMVSVLFCLIFGEQLVRLIRQPIDAALRRANVISAVQDDVKGFSLWTWITSGIKGQIIPPSVRDEDKALLKVLSEDEKREIKIDISAYDLIAELHKVAPDAFPEPAETLKDQSLALPVRSESFREFRRAAEKVDRPVTLNVQEAFMTYMKVSFIAGLVIASPWMFYQLWLFVAAGLYPHERKYVHTYLPMSILLFLGGVVFCFYAVLPTVLDFLLSYNNNMELTAQIRISEWISFAVMLPLMFGISCQLPLAMLFLSKINIFKVENYIDQWRLAFLAIAIISMVLTPTPDPLTMIMMMTPLLVLYGLGIALCKWSVPKSPLGEPA